MKTPVLNRGRGIRFAFSFCIRCIIGYTKVCVGIQNGEKHALKSVDKYRKKHKNPCGARVFDLAEAVGFEPTATTKKALIHNNK
jgi:hypothetical protein